MSDDRLPEGRPPWDPLNGLRIGALAGGVIGVILTLIAGGAIGYWSEKRKQRL
jgi:hypothetical protein